MFRADEGLAFLLRYENIAWYEDGAVKILDRRIYPIRVESVICRRHEEVAQAIADMVTQSGGPYTAAAMGMALAAYEARDLEEGAYLPYLEKAAYDGSARASLVLGKLALAAHDAAKTTEEKRNQQKLAFTWFQKAEEQNFSCFEKDVYEQLRQYK